MCKQKKNSPYLSLAPSTGKKRNAESFLLFVKLWFSWKAKRIELNWKIIFWNSYKTFIFNSIFLYIYHGFLYYIFPFIRRVCFEWDDQISSSWSPSGESPSVIAFVIQACLYPKIRNLWRPWKNFKLTFSQTLYRNSCFVRYREYCSNTSPYCMMNV